MKLYVKMSFISTFSFFLVFKHNVIRSANLTRISASSTASGDVTY